MQAGDQDVLAVLGTEERSLALFYVEPILAERIDDVRLVRNENRIGAWHRCSAEQLAKSVDAAGVLVRRYDQTAFGNIRGLFDVLEPGDDRSLIGSVVLAGKNAANRYSGLTDGVAESLRQSFALVIEISLRRDVIEVERIGVGLIRECCAVADDDD